MIRTGWLRRMGWIRHDQDTVNAEIKRAKAKGKQVESEGGYLCSRDCYCGGGYGVRYHSRPTKEHGVSPSEILQRRRLEHKLEQLNPVTDDEAKIDLATMIFKDTIKIYPKMDKQYIIKTALEYSKIGTHRHFDNWILYKRAEQTLLEILEEITV